VRSIVSPIEASFEVAGRGEHTVLRARGEIDVASVPVFQARLQQLVAGRSPRVVVDMTDVQFIDSAGLRVLVDGLTTARRRDGDLRVACPRASLRRTFEITGLDQLLGVHASLEEATDR
jgi:anti-sigma B factor antagonist